MAAGMMCNYDALIAASMSAEISANKQPQIVIVGGSPAFPMPVAQGYPAAAMTHPMYAQPQPQPMYAQQQPYPMYAQPQPNPMYAVQQPQPVDPSKLPA
jgi:ABC-type microcin C transport system permease subunit YejE